MLNLNKCTKTKPKPKLTLIFKNCSYVYAYHWAQLLYTTQNKTVPIIFLHILQTIIIAQMMSTGGEGDEERWSPVIPLPGIHTHNRFTALFSDHPGEPVPEEDDVTDHPAGCHYIQTNQCLPPPSPHIFYRPDALPASQPTASKHWRQLAHSDKGEDARILLNSVTCTVSVPSTAWH